MVGAGGTWWGLPRECNTVPECLPPMTITGDQWSFNPPAKQADSLGFWVAGWAE